MADNPEGVKARIGLQFTRMAPTYDDDGTFAHFGRRLVDAVGVEPGQRVLDVASGRGAVLFPASERVGPTGHVEGIDLAEGMVAAVNADAERLGIPARVRVMDAEHLDFPDASFDRVFCGFGIMFPPDQAQVLREMRRVLRSGGRLGVTTWQAPRMQDLDLVLARMGQKSSLPPGQIADPAVLTDVVVRAGFSDVRVDAETRLVERVDADTYWQQAMRSAMSRNLEALSAEQVNQVRAALADQLEQYRQADGLHVPVTALLATASR
ncbi:MAG: methyltransferase domain-containing protein [Chloroflexota bacterium]